MKLVIPILFAFMCITAFGNKSISRNEYAEHKAKNIKVMTYNIHHCNPPSAGEKIDVAAIAKVINDESPDFVALQEVDVYTLRSGKGLNQAKELARLTGMNFFFQKR